MKSQLLIHINDNPILADITFGYIKGRPAYTPRGEYAPIDPPEPPEVDIQKVMVMHPNPRGESPAAVWDEAPAWLVDILASDDDIINQLIEAAEDRLYQEQEEHEPEY